MCKVGCGVLQGCPLASILFVLAVEPFCILLNSAVNNRGIVELCADDIAIVLQSWFDLPSVYKVFEYARRAANLHLKPRKCFLIPLSAPLTANLLEILKDFLRASIPNWIEFSISSHALYLGIWLGPTAGSMQWTSQISKYIERVNLISSSGVSSDLATRAYNLKVANTLSYPAQFLSPPPNLTKLEKYAFVKMYKVPYNTFAHQEQFTLHNDGIPCMNSLHVLFTAIKARFLHANSTLIHHCANSLINSSDSLRLSDLPNCSRSFWDSPAIAFSILHGARGDHLPEQSDDDDYASFITSAVTSDTDHVQRAGPGLPAAPMAVR
eukprot:6278287-Karenia_brevis.AAC.1